jgi:hypothetical protein
MKQSPATNVVPLRRPRTPQPAEGPVRLEQVRVPEVSELRHRELFDCQGEGPLSCRLQQGRFSETGGSQT